MVNANLGFVMLPKLTFFYSDMDRVPLSALAQHENILQDRARLAILQSRQHTNRMTQLTNIFYQTLSIVRETFWLLHEPSF